MNLFQSLINEWMETCFGYEITKDKIERNYRFLEESLELVQSNGCSKEDAHRLVEYVYGRPDGDTNQEVGGVMVILAALCNCNNILMEYEAFKELARIDTEEMIDKIRHKQASKKIKSGPLP